MNKYQAMRKKALEENPAALRAIETTVGLEAHLERWNEELMGRMDRRRAEILKADPRNKSDAWLERVRMEEHARMVVEEEILSEMLKT